MTDLSPIYVYPAYDGATDTTTWSGYVLTPDHWIATASKLTREAVIAHLTRALRREVTEAGPVQVCERPWRKGYVCAISVSGR